MCRLCPPGFGCSTRRVSTIESGSSCRIERAVATCPGDLVNQIRELEHRAASEQCIVSGVQSAFQTQLGLAAIAQLPTRCLCAIRAAAARPARVPMNPPLSLTAARVAELSLRVARGKLLALVDHGCPVVDLLCRGGSWTAADDANSRARAGWSGRSAPAVCSAPHEFATRVSR